jgi:Tfp pilus assembly protein FimT
VAALLWPSVTYQHLVRIEENYRKHRHAGRLSLRASEANFNWSTSTTTQAERVKAMTAKGKLRSWYSKVRSSRLGGANRGCSAVAPPRTDGFSMLELLIVVSIVITVTAISLPTFTNLVATTKLHGAMGNLSSLFQNSRSLAVRQNTISRVRFQLTSNRWVAFVDNGVNPAGLTTSAPQLWLPLQFSKEAAPSGGAGAPTPVDNATCGANSVTTLDGGDTYFNQLGIPCQYSSGTCSGGQAFAYYFKHTPTSGSARWAAMCVSPAGRVKTWYWNGSSWTN